MTRALLIGASGFIGRHVADVLAANGAAVVGGGRREPPCGWPHDWVACDLRDPGRIATALAQSEPEVVFHLAGAPPGDFAELLAVNVAGTAYLIDAVRAASGQVRVVIAGSAAEYGAVSQSELPVSESAPPRPVSRYGIAKAAQTLLALTTPADVVVARLFNLTGPGEPPTLAAGSFAEQIVELERRHSDGEVAVGALEPERDFVDVRDAAQALTSLAERGGPGEVYNVCSGQAASIGEVFATLARLAHVAVRPRVDPARAARAGVARIFGSPDKLRAATGWSPVFALHQSLADLLAARRASGGAPACTSG